MSGRQANGGYVPVDAVFSGAGGAFVQLSAGEKLREARVKAGLTLDSAAARTRVKRDYLDALETMDSRGLPSRAYAIGYLRTYARFLDLDECALVEQFKAEADTQTGRAQPTAPTEKREIRLPRGAFGAVFILAGVIGIGWWYAATTSGENAFADVPPPPDAVSEWENAAFQSAPRASVQDIWANLPSHDPRLGVNDVVLRATAPVWLEVRDANDRVLFARELAAGEAYRAVSEPGLTVTAADGGVVVVELDGVAAGPLGRAGVEVNELPLAFETIQSALAEMAPRR